MSKKRADWLRTKLRTHKANLAKDLPLKHKNGTLTSWYRPTLRVEDAIYSLIDIKKERAELEVKQQLVQHYLDLVNTPNLEKDDASKKALEKAIHVWVQSYPGKPPL